VRNRVHIFGASGSGTSSLGRAIAVKHDLAFFEADDFFWQPSDPPYQHARERSERQRVLTEALSGSSRWVLAGSVSGWGDAAIPFFDLAVFITTPTLTRLARLRARESERFGMRILEQGDMYQHHEAFMAWASKYDDGPSEMRSRVRHEAWLSGLPCPIARVEGSLPLDSLCAHVSTAMAA
jgi:adenylate kinase family enzyme